MGVAAVAHMSVCLPLLQPAAPHGCITSHDVCAIAKAYMEPAALAGLKGRCPTRSNIVLFIFLTATFAQSWALVTGTVSLLERRTVETIFVVAASISLRAWVSALSKTN